MEGSMTFVQKESTTDTPLAKPWDPPQAPASNYSTSIPDLHHGHYLSIVCAPQQTPMRICLGAVD